MARAPSLTLSKSRFCYGLQCLRQLWWRFHEPDAPELQADASLQAIFDQGHRVGALAQRQFEGGTLIGHEYWQVPEKVADTQAALAAKAPVIFEAAFSADGVYVAIDALQRRRGGHALVEVKSSTKVKEQYLPDVAIQLHVARQAGLDVPRAELMHLNSACRFPDLSNLFTRADVTAEAEALLPAIPGQLKRMRRALEGKLPEVEPGPHCDEPYECPFKARCHPEVGDDHVSTLYLGRRIAEALLADGVASLRKVPEDAKLSAIQARQVRAGKTGKVVVEGPLSEALAALAPPVAYLDFETINPAIPVWKGCGPFMQIPVQMSCHVVGARGAVTHHEHLAEGPDDPRPAMAEAVVRACAGAETVVAYNASFEKRCLEHLAEQVPSQRAALKAVAKRLVDLLPIVRNHVYHPDFGGGFSMKVVAPALAGLDYSGLEIGEGGTASAVLAGLLLDGASIPAAERKRLRRLLLAYCEQDTLAMVKVVERLRTLAG
jgi:hypothetical protein